MAAYQLSQFGFFFVGDSNYTHVEDFDRRLIALLHRHSHLSATCPFTFVLNGDDKRFTGGDIAREIGPFIRTQFVLEMLKPLNFSARPVVHFSGPARPVIQFLILSPFGPVWGPFGAPPKSVKFNLLN